MKIKNKKLIASTLIFAAFAGFIFLGQGCVESTSTGDGSEEDVTSASSGLSWMVPIDVSDTGSQDAYYELAWQSFIPLIWPATNNYRGEPDTTKNPGDKDGSGKFIPIVWETWKDVFEVMLPAANDPGPWNHYDSMPCGNGPGDKHLNAMSKSADLQFEVQDAFDQATGQPLIDMDTQYVRFEIKMNESEYNWVRQYEYYNGDKQKTAVHNVTFQTPPKTGTDAFLQNQPPPFAQYGATEVKASWRIFKPGTPASITDRYYTRECHLIMPDGSCSQQTYTAGLIGLHILRLTPETGSTWYWATFEQVDNVELQSQFGGTLPPHPTFNTQPPQSFDTGYSYIPNPISYDSTQSTPPVQDPVLVSRWDQIPAGVNTVNTKYNQLLQGTVWQYYQLVGTVNPPTQGNYYSDGQAFHPPVNTDHMYNTTMETYSYGSNCVSCHYYGLPQHDKADATIADSLYQIFTFLLGDAATPTSGN